MEDLDREFRKMTQSIEALKTTMEKTLSNFKTTIDSYLIAETKIVTQQKNHDEILAKMLYFERGEMYEYALICKEELDRRQQYFVETMNLLNK